MMAFPSMLTDACEKEGIAVPPDPDDEESWDKNDYPHFYVFCALQLCRPIEWGEHWENAKIIANIETEKLKTMKLDDFLALGLKFRT